MKILKGHLMWIRLGFIHILFYKYIVTSEHARYMKRVYEKDFKTLYITNGFNSSTSSN